MQVMHVISNLDTGGAETSLYQLAINNSVDKQIVVSMQDDGAFGERLREQGIEVHTLNMQPGKLSWSGLVKLFKLIRNKRPAVIQTWMYHADLVAGLVARLALNNRVSWGVHHSNLDRAANSTALLFVVKLCAIFSWFVPRTIVSCSERSMQIHTAARYRGSKFTVVPNGYDLTRFVFNQESREAFRSGLNVKSECLLGMVGRWHPQKDHQNLIDAMALVNSRGAVQLRCVLVGRGVDESNPDLLRALENAGVRDQFLLLGETDDVPAVMSGIDIHILSSRGEAFPNVVAEAMACNTPCVVTDVGDAGLIVGDTGWCVPPESARELAAGIEDAARAAEQGAAWQARCESCRARIASDYEITQIVDKYRAVWRSIANL